jgi:hypothetical protein
MTLGTRESGVSLYPAERVRRRRGGLGILFTIVLVLLAIAVVADRVAAQAAERELRSKVVQELASRNVGYNSLDVNVGGVPFLTQVAEGRYDEITIELTDVTLPPEAGRGAHLPALHVVATGVTADAQELVQGTAQVAADQVTGTAVVSYQTLSELLDLSQYSLSDVVFSEEAGALRVDAKANVAGLSLPIKAVADVSVVNSEIQVKMRDAAAVGVQAPPVARNFIDNLVNRSISARLPQLPFGLTLDRLNVTTDGLAITATGHEVPLVR